MSEFILELYSEEIPPNLQINARNDLQEKIKSSLIEENLKIGSLKAFSSPTRLTILLKDFSDKIKIPSKEIRGPKVGVMEDIINNFIKAHSSSRKDLLEKQSEKGNFYYIKTKTKEVLTSEMKIHLLSPADGKVLKAVGSVLKSGKRLLVVQSNIYSLGDKNEKLVATMLGTMVPSIVEI